MEAIIHPGMHKTGSSSIQETLVSVKPEGWIPPDTLAGNMSGLFALFFEDNPHEHHSFKARGLSVDDVQTERTVRFKKFQRQIEVGAEKGLNSIFTGEHIGFGTRIGNKRMADFYKKHGYQPRVIAYVRRPMSFMQSAFQQRIKTNLRKLDPQSGLWPKYRDRFEKMDDIFGRENVQLCIFDTNYLVEGDVCIDFFNKIGVEIKSNQVIRVNEGLSLSACALLYAQRNLGEGFVQGFNGASQKNNNFIAALSRFSGPPLKFKRSFVEPIFEEWRGDLEWMEERIGFSLSDMPEEDMPDAVGSSEDLLLVADRHREELEEMLIAEVQKEGASPRDRLTRSLELMRKLHY